MAFNFLPSLDKPVESLESKPTTNDPKIKSKPIAPQISGTTYKLKVLADQLSRLDAESIKRDALIETSKETNSHFWERMSFSEIGIIRDDRLHIRIYPHGYRGDDQVASIQYRVDVNRVMGDQEFAFSEEWVTIGSLLNRKNKLIFFLDKMTDSMKIGSLLILKTRLKNCGFTDTNCLTKIGCSFYDCHPMLDPRLQKRLRLTLKPGLDRSKPFEITTDTRELDPCSHVRPCDQVSTVIQNDSRRASKKIRLLENQNENLRKLNESQQTALDATRKKQMATLSNADCKKIDRWYKIDKTDIVRIER